MTHDTNALGQTIRRIAMLGIPLLVAATGTAAAHGGGGDGGGMMGGGGWGLFGGGMAVWGLLWMGVLIAVPLYLAYTPLDRGSGEDDTRSIPVLRERYARGDLSQEEFERRYDTLERSE